ncbi:DeoR/GlpR family DNA-binding transcription regulator [Bordetella bronchialis]|uniref:Alkaline phosphatase n=2 Tax=Bordetella bronchialis TaxID=463025 RepID=A0A193G5A8_9BORD|nr:DeoR/GlpR family DNA-binding transcription regulator [Bordetella bronchialis]ANN69252.1 alkaline phosphatase [Bordetella bronchialis]ANN74404.1 alkaline phosphatase [Bordetella bronchialis]
MWQEERYQRIRKMLEALRSVSTDRIVDELGVSRETVRRDLIALEAMGALRRSHGGAVLPDGAPHAAGGPPADGRHLRAIARAVAGKLTNGQTLFMEAGIMAVPMADALSALHDITLITNSFDAATRVAGSEDHAAHGNRVFVLGGAVLPPLAATQGDRTIAEIHRHTADTALLFPSGIDARHGATHADLARAELGRAMAANARDIVVMADDARIAVNTRASYCAADRVSVLVTNRKSEAKEGYDMLAGAVGHVVLA